MARWRHRGQNGKDFRGGDYPAFPGKMMSGVTASSDGLQMKSIFLPIHITYANHYRLEVPRLEMPMSPQSRFSISLVQIPGASP